MKELDKPLQEKIGANQDKWFVYATPDINDAEAWALSAVTLTLKSVPLFVTDAESEEFYFDSELEVYQSAYNYYTLHGQTYPYMKELLTLETQCGIGAKQSRTMEFI